MTSDTDSRFDFPARAADARTPVLDDAIHLWVHDTGIRQPRAVRAAARAALERLLRHYAGDVALGIGIGIETGRHGKPFAPALPELDFNLSHAGSHVVFAFARNQTLGVDIEEYARELAVEGIAGRFFSAAESAALARMAPAGRTAAFLRLWTHKEAVLKALGEGLSFGLDRVEFELDADGQAGPMRRIASVAGQPDEWQVRRFAPAEGVTGSIAWRGPPRAVQLFRLSP
jgi:4'-phosphopantetheinyl transferase